MDLLDEMKKEGLIDTKMFALYIDSRGNSSMKIGGPHDPEAIMEGKEMKYV